MKVEILEPKGYCSGVTNAINLALKAKEEHQNEDVYVLGMLVHNEQVISFLKEKNIQIIDKEDALSLKEGSIIIFTAHGHTKEMDKIALDKKFVVYDAICPKVKQNITLIENELKNGHKVIYIGVKNHPEAEAALSISENVHLYNKKDVFDYSKVDDDSPLVINQTTLNVLDLKEIHEDIISKIPHARLQDEICNTTRMRQKAISELPIDVDLIIVVGDKKSSNTNRLLEIAKSTHKDVDSIMVSEVNELDTNILKNKNHVVISSGASTPVESINAIYELIKNY